MYPARRGHTSPRSIVLYDAASHSLKSEKDYEWVSKFFCFEKSIYCKSPKSMRPTFTTRSIYLDDFPRVYKRWGWRGRRTLMEKQEHFEWKMKEVLSFNEIKKG